jgi:hypothetical protein
MNAEITHTEWRIGGIFAACIAFSIALGIASFFFFQFNRDSRLKRRVWPALVVGYGILFVAFVLYETRGNTLVLFLTVPAVIVISFLNLRGTRFCDSCGRTLYRQPVFSQSQFCPYCGAPLLQK